jgi:heme/copper-type cytochrome/quinol oxidase subunit 2
MRRRSRSVLIIWPVPIAIVTALGIMAWSMTHHLNPHKPIQPAIKPVSIEAMSLDWKWLFTLLIMILFVGGTFWIMYNLSYRMM